MKIILLQAAIGAGILLIFFFACSMIIGVPIVMFLLKNFRRKRSGKEYDPDEDVYQLTDERILRFIISIVIVTLLFIIFIRTLDSVYKFQF